MHSRYEGRYYVIKVGDEFLTVRKSSLEPNDVWVFSADTIHECCSFVNAQLPKSH